MTIIPRDQALKDEFLSSDLVNANGNTFGEINFVYDNDSADLALFFEEDYPQSALGISKNVSGNTPYAHGTGNNKNDIKTALKGAGENPGIIDFILINSGFVLNNKIPDALKDLLIEEATSFGTVYGQPKNVNEIIKNLVQILERYDNDADSNVGIKNHVGDVIHDSTKTNKEVFNKYFSKFSSKFAKRDFEYSEEDKDKIDDVFTKKYDLEGTATFNELTSDPIDFIPDSVATGDVDNLNQRKAIYAAIDIMTAPFIIENAVKERLINEAALLSTGDISIDTLLNNISTVLERYDTE